MKNRNCCVCEEWKKIVWPSFTTAIKQAIAVCVAMFLIGMFILVCDGIGKGLYLGLVNTIVR